MRLNLIVPFCKALCVDSALKCPAPLSCPGLCSIWRPRWASGGWGGGRGPSLPRPWPWRGIYLCLQKIMLTIFLFETFILRPSLWCFQQQHHFLSEKFSKYLKVSNFRSFMCVLGSLLWVFIHFRPFVHCSLFLWIFTHPFNLRFEWFM